jgi:hypothetical protein
LAEQVGLRFEAWTLPWSGSFDRVIADIPVPVGQASGTLKLNDFAAGVLAVPVDYPRLDELVTDTAGRLIRVYDGSTLIHEYMAERVDFNLSETGLATISGADIGSAFDRAVIYPYDYEGSPADFPNHVWGGPQILDNLGFELAENQNEIYEVWTLPETYFVDIGTATGGTFTLTVEAQTTNNIAYNASFSTVITELELLSTVTEVDVSGTGTTADPWSITFRDPHVLATGQMTGSGTLLTPSDTLTVTNTRDPDTSFTLTMEGDTTGSINWAARLTTRGVSSS